MPFIDYIVQSVSKFTVYRFVGELWYTLYWFDTWYRPMHLIKLEVTLQLWSIDFSLDIDIYKKYSYKLATLSFSTNDE